MLDGVTRRVPAAEHWNLFRQAEQDQPELINSLIQKVHRYVADKHELNSTATGSEILGRWSKRDEWSRTFPANGSKLFGMVMWVAMYDDSGRWQTATELDLRVYRRVAEGEA